MRTIIVRFIGLIAIAGLAAPVSICQDELQYPWAVAVGKNGTLFVSDRNLPGIWKVEKGDKSVFFKAAKQFRTPLNAVRCLAVDSNGYLYAGDSATREVYRFDATGKPVALTNGAIGNPTAMAFDSSGNLFVADLELRKIYRVETGTNQVEEWKNVPAPRGLAVDMEGGVWVLSNSKQPLIRYNAEREQEILVKESPFEFPNQLVLDEKGNGYVCDGYAKAIWKISRNGKIETVFRGPPLTNPVGIALDGNRLFISDPHQRMVYALALDGSTTLEPVINP